MPTSPRKARILLKDGKAKVINRTPFVIKLNYNCGETIQSIVLGVDAGSKTIGLSASTEKEELYASELELRNDISELLATRASFRRTRRNRKTRYRKARFLNRTKTKKKGWLAPSIRNKIDNQIKVISYIYKILPISKIIVEVASFDIQKIKNPDIDGKDYQQGEQLGFWNVREYVLFRDGHKCHGRKGCKEKILNVHHIESRKTGGNAPNNLITLCEKCHKDYHNGKLKLNLKRSKSFTDASFMGIMRWAFYNKLKELYVNVSLTYGYITKNTRIKNGLEKSHKIDALCIAGHPTAKLLNNWYYCKQVRGQNRQLHKATINKGGIRKNNKAERFVFGFQLFDKVLYNKKEYFIFGRRKTGSFNIRTLNKNKLDINYKKLNLLEKAKTILFERRN
jgi:5-methylcytosine-specific restriction endonuclease McrA